MLFKSQGNLSECNGFFLLFNQGLQISQTSFSQKFMLALWQISSG